MAVTPPRKRAAGASSKARPKVVIRNAKGRDLLDGFRDFVLEDSDVQEALRNVRSARDVTKLAARYGFTISESDVRAAAKSPRAELSVDELGGLVGAAPCWCNKSVVNSKSCKK